MTANKASQNYTATEKAEPNKTISGKVSASGKGLGGVTIAFSGAGSATTKSDGTYSHNVPHGYSGTATPSLSGYTFTPASIKHTNVTANKANQNYTSTEKAEPNKTISGKVSDSAGTGIPGVTITFSNGGGSVTTDNNGNYSHSLRHGWSGRATPAKSGTTFDPEKIDYNNITVNQANQNFTATVSQETFKLTVAIEGNGTVTADPDLDSYPAGILVTLTAKADKAWAFDGWSGMVSETDLPTTTVTMDSDLEVVATFTQDSDRDGVTNIEEQGPQGDDTAYDGNKDGVADAQQNTCASMHSYDGRAYVTIECGAGAFSAARSIETPNGGNLPDGAEFPVGFFEFNMDSMAVGEATTVGLHLPATVKVQTYFKYGPTPDNAKPHWYEFKYDPKTGVGAEIDGDVITLHFIDGALGDGDLTANGSIADPGGPSLPLVVNPEGGISSPETDSGSGDGGGGGGCFLQALFY